MKFEGSEVRVQGASVRSNARDLPGPFRGSRCTTVHPRIDGLVPQNQHCNVSIVDKEAQSPRTLQQKAYAHPCGDFSGGVGVPLSELTLNEGTYFEHRFCMHITHLSAFDALGKRGIYYF